MSLKTLKDAVEQVIQTERARCVKIVKDGRWIAAVARTAIALLSRSSSTRQRLRHSLRSAVRPQRAALVGGRRSAAVRAAGRPVGVC